MTAPCSVPALTIWVVQALAQKITPTRAATGANPHPPAGPTGLQVSAAPDSPTLTWPAATDRMSSHHAVTRRNPASAPLRVFPVIGNNADTATGCSAVSRCSADARADTPGRPAPHPEPTPVNPSLANLANANLAIAALAARVPESAVQGGPAQQSTPPPPPFGTV